MQKTDCVKREFPAIIYRYLYKKLYFHTRQLFCYKYIANL